MKSISVAVSPEKGDAAPAIKQRSAALLKKTKGDWGAFEYRCLKTVGLTNCLAL